MGLFDHDHCLFNILIDLEPYCTKGIPLKLFKTYLPERIQYTAINNDILESLNDSATCPKGVLRIQASVTDLYLSPILL